MKCALKSLPVAITDSSVFKKKDKFHILLDCVQKEERKPLKK